MSVYWLGIDLYDFSGHDTLHILCCVLLCLSSSCVLCILCRQFLWSVHSWLPLRYFLDCPFLISPSVFSGLSILDCPFSFSGLSILDCPFDIFWTVHSWLPLQNSLECPILIDPSVSLDCPFLIAPSVFSGLSILDCPFSILWIVHSWLPLRYFLTFIYMYSSIG